MQVFLAWKHYQFSKIYGNEFFGYTKITIEQPLVEDGEVKTDKKGNTKSDSSKRDFERVPLGQDIGQYFETEIKPHLPEAWMDRSKDKVGYEINFTKYFRRNFIFQFLVNTFLSMFYRIPQRIRF